jgi:hypothetical protein
MLKNFVLGTEIAKAGNFHIANISMAIKEFGLTEGVDFLKFGGITLLSKNSLLLPKNINKIILTENTTDLSEYLPFYWFMGQVENQTRMIKDRYEVVKIEGKKFINITDKELKEVMFNEKLVKYVCDSHEIQDLINNNYIKGHIKLSNKKYLTWY